MSTLAKIYVTYVKRGLKTIDLVPESVRQEVIEALEAEGFEFKH